MAVEAGRAASNAVKRFGSMQKYACVRRCLSTTAVRASRMGYLKDAVLPRVLDDATFATLSSLMLFNNIEVRMRAGGRDGAVREGR